MGNVTESQKKLADDITVCGWHVIKVLGDEQGPGFGYSVGLFHSYQHAEIIIVGLKLDLIHSIINSIAEEIKNGVVYHAGQYYSGLIGGYDCYFLEVDKDYYEAYVGQALQYYSGTLFPLLQCIYPTKSNVYPWQSEWPEQIKGLQPVLGDFKL
jgi:hypothetical protein